MSDDEERVEDIRRRIALGAMKSMDAMTPEMLTQATVMVEEMTKLDGCLRELGMTVTERTFYLQSLALATVFGEAGIDVEGER